VLGLDEPVRVDDAERVLPGIKREICAISGRDTSMPNWSTM